MFVVPIQTYILIYKKIYEHWGVAGTLVVVVFPRLLSLNPTTVMVVLLLGLWLLLGCDNRAHRRGGSS